MSPARKPPGKRARREREEPPPQRRRPLARALALDLALLLAAFAAGTVIAELAGAVNLGTALTFGQLAFAAAVVYILLRR